MYPYDQNNQQMYEQYAQAHDTGDYSGIDQDQAVNHLQRFAQNAPPEVQQGVYQQYFQQMPPYQREQFAQQIPPQYAVNPNNPQQMAQGFQQMSQQQPNILQQLLNQNGAMGNPLVKAGLIGIAALAAKHLLSNQRGGGLGGMVGELLGGGQQYPQYGYGRGDHDDYRREGWGRDRDDYRREYHDRDDEHHHREHHHEH